MTNNDPISQSGTSKVAPPNDGAEKGGTWEFVKMLAIALGIAFIMRTFVFQPFHIPSQSMEPTLYKGDYIITTKYSLGYGKYAASPFTLPVKKGRIFERIPKRGDIIVFKPPGQNIHFIKRLIGLPGDRIQMRAGQLYINGQASALRPLEQDGSTAIFEETFPGGARPHAVQDTVRSGPVDDTNIFTVPAGHYFFLGDNRDKSADSRLSAAEQGIGYIPASHLVGRAEFIMMAVKPQFSIWRPWTWYHFNTSRFFKGLG